MKTIRDSIDDPIPVIVYAAKSTEDKRGSIPTQIADCERAIAEAPGTRIIVASFQDEGKSAYTGSRGEGLQAAKEAAIAAAEKYGTAELWAQHSDRFARGDGRQAKHLLEHWFELGRRDVVMRSVQDDSNLHGLLPTAMIGERNTEDSRRKSEAVKSGKERQFANGDHLGGPTPDGYATVRSIGPDGAVKRGFEIDPTRAEVIEAIFEMSERGVSDGVIARTLNADGLRTKAGATWTRRRIQSTVTNPFYAGRVARDRGASAVQRVASGKHPALIDPQRFDAIQSLRPLRDLGKGTHKRVGRPNRRHLLARVATCADCGSRMYCVSSSYKPKHKPRQLTYQCANYKDSTGLCHASPIDARLVDGTLVAHLPSLLLQFDEWASAIAAGGSELRNSVQEALAKTEASLRSAGAERSRLLDQFSKAVAQDDNYAKTLVDADTRLQQRIAQLVHRRDEMKEILDSEPSQAAADSVTATMRRIETAVARDDSDDAGAIPSANEALREVFDQILLATEPDGSITIDFHFTEAYEQLGVLVFDSSERDWATIHFVGVPDPQPVPTRIRPEDSSASPKLSNAHESPNFAQVAPPVLPTLRCESGSTASRTGSGAVGRTSRRQRVRS